MIAAIENAILAKLKAAADDDVLGYKFGLLESYPEDWDEYLKDKPNWRGTAAWVAFAGCGEQIHTDDGQLHWPATFFLVVAAESSRNETARRHGETGAAAQPGSYQMLTDAVSLLAGQDLDLAIQPFTIGSARLVRNPAQLAQRNVSSYAVELKTTIFVQRFAEEMGNFRLFHANWDVRPFGNVDGDDDTPGKQIPADETADATDHLEIPET
jgi:phage gp37-like protein